MHDCVLHIINEPMNYSSHDALQMNLIIELKSTIIRIRFFYYFITLLQFLIFFLQKLLLLFIKDTLN